VAPGAPAADTPQTTDGANDAATSTPGAAPNASPSAGADPTTEPASAAKPSATTTASPGPSAPDPVIGEAKALAARARALLKAAIERAKREHAELKDDQDKINTADKDIDDAARTLSAADKPASYSALGQGVAAPTTDAAPSVSVQA
jgi:hypothetical protein